MDLKKLASQLEGELYSDSLHRILYSADASVYREVPLAVAYPKHGRDLRALIEFAAGCGIPLIPRAAGTSLGGQVVGGGLVVDITKHLNRILEINKDERWARVEPGVVRDQLNLALAPMGLFFPPETSTANRAAIGGMIGNNSSGANSIVYGTTRENVLEVKALLSDGSEAEFRPLDREALEKKMAGTDLEARVYRKLEELLSDAENCRVIREGFPKASITRRNTGYAVDILLDQITRGEPLNLSSLICGAEGTLALVTEAKLKLSPLPPPAAVLICAQFSSIKESLEANVIAISKHPFASELMDNHVIDCALANPLQKQNCSFIEGAPKAVLAIEFRGNNQEDASAQALDLVAELRERNLGYAFPVLSGSDLGKVWALRKASLGLLHNVAMDGKPLSVIEDSAVDVADLPQYVSDLADLFAQHGVSCVHYGHAGAGVLHLKPVLDLKTPAGRKTLHALGRGVAELVKKHGGSLSGEHGDGRVRGEFISLILGEKNYLLLKEIKRLFDPLCIFNPGKIIDTPAMNEGLRDAIGDGAPVRTTFHFRGIGSMEKAADRCSGSGDCLKSRLFGGTMCPSYMATRNEKDSTRGRANVLREMIRTAESPFDRDEVIEVLDLCLSCKGCQNECPSNVDMARLKAEALQQRYDKTGTPFKAWAVGHYPEFMRMLSIAPSVANVFFTKSWAAWIPKLLLKVAPERSLPPLSSVSLDRWFRSRTSRSSAARRVAENNGKVFLFADEFTNYQDAHVGIAAVELLERLGYEVILAPVHSSGRTLLSKGLVRKAKRNAEENVRRLHPLVSKDAPLIGLEPSAILTFRDEYPDLVDDALLDSARHVASCSLLLDEFLSAQADKGLISPENFNTRAQKILLHGHCHQKAIAGVNTCRRMLSFPRNYSVEIIPSGCCGMAGNFGYEHDHYKLSMQIGELVLFPAVRGAPPDTLIVAPGTSCRAQIKSGTGRDALHPAEVLLNALIDG